VNTRRKNRQSENPKAQLRFPLKRPCKCWWMPCNHYRSALWELCKPRRNTWK